MSGLFLSPSGGPIYTCPRCHFKVYYNDTVVDPNNGLRVCTMHCGADDFDPWRKPARQTEKIALEYPRPDDTLILDPNYPGDVNGPING